MQVVFHVRSIHAKAQLRLIQQSQWILRLQIVSKSPKIGIRFRDFEARSSARHGTPFGCGCYACRRENGREKSEACKILQNRLQAPESEA